MTLSSGIVICSKCGLDVPYGEFCFKCQKCITCCECEKESEYGELKKVAPPQIRKVLEYIEWQKRERERYLREQKRISKLMRKLRRRR